MENNLKIDFVITWVDGSDPEWIADKNNYLSEKDKINATNCRFRDWDILKYWFRGVEKYAPWVNHIYFITWGHIPEWLNTDNPKLTVVRHEDYIPKEYLPTFSSHPIELNMHRISGLEEHFVYFNDDMFLTDYVKKEDFFENGLPKDIALLHIFNKYDYNDDFEYYSVNDITIINKHFKKKTVTKKYRSKYYNLKYNVRDLIRNIYLSFTNDFSVFHIRHLPQVFLKSTFSTIWSKEYDILNEVSKHKFRNYKDVTQSLMAWWQLCEGKFIPMKEIGQYYNIGNENDYNMIYERKYKYICLNDTVDTINFEDKKKQIQAAFEKALPEKSSFEK